MFSSSSSSAKSGGGDSESVELEYRISRQGSLLISRAQLMTLYLCVNESKADLEKKLLPECMSRIKKSLTLVRNCLRRRPIRQV